MLSFEIRNRAQRNLEYSSKESGISLTTGIRESKFLTDKESEIQYLESGIHVEESRMQDCPFGFVYIQAHGAILL